MTFHMIIGTGYEYGSHGRMLRRDIEVKGWNWRCRESNPALSGPPDPPKYKGLDRKGRALRRA